MEYTTISKTVTTVPLSEQKFDVEQDGTVFHVTKQDTAQVKKTVYEQSTEGFGWGLLGLFLVIAALVATPLVLALVSGSLAIALPVGIGALVLGCVCIGVGAHKHNKSINNADIVIKKAASPGNTGEKEKSKDVKQEKDTKELLSEQQQNKTNNNEATISTYNTEKQNKILS